MKNKFIVLNSKDNCATVLEDISQDAKIKILDEIIEIHQNIPLGHKFAIKEIKSEEYVIKYGEIIGIATEDIKQGDWIHTHNITSAYLEVTNNK